MANEGDRNMRLGLFVTIGTALLIAALYFIGNKQNLFGSTFKISANFYNVSGLMKGNNVRFSGIDVGTVESVEIMNDSLVKVVMIIEKNIQPYLRKNAIANVGTDGLMGNKLININAGNKNSPMIEENDILQTLRPVEMDDMIRTLNVTNENIKFISGNLRNITDKINSKNSLWSLLMDTVVAENVKSTIVNIKLMSNQSVQITGDLKLLTENIKNGKGTIGALITDTSMAGKINQIVVKLTKLSDTAAVLTGDASLIIRHIKQGKGSVGVLLNDTMLVSHLNASLVNLKSGTNNFDQNMEALKISWPFKKYFKKQKKNETKK